MKCIHFFIVAPVASLWLASTNGDESKSARLRPEVFCFNGKIDSRSSCTAVPGSVPQSEGKMKCGYQGEVSEIEWSFVKTEDGRDVYAFTRRFSVDSENPKVESKRVAYDGKRLIVFEDEHQVIVVRPVKE